MFVHVVTQIRIEKDERVLPMDGGNSTKNSKFQYAIYSSLGFCLYWMQYFLVY